MFRRMMTGAIVTTLAMAGLPGCMPEMTMEDMAKMRPDRPPELDRLNAFVGTWKGTGTANMMGIDEPMKLTGTSKTAWGVDNWCIVEHGDYEMEGMGDMKGLGVWTWDARAKKYRTWWFDNFGVAGQGTLTYSKASDCWFMTVRGKSAMGSTRGAGCITFKDKDTMEWTWKEWPAWDLLGLFNFMDMKGTSTRQ